MKKLGLVITAMITVLGVTLLGYSMWIASNSGSYDAKTLALFAIGIMYFADRIDCYLMEIDYDE